jgi:protein MpaA
LKKLRLRLPIDPKDWIAAPRQLFQPDPLPSFVNAPALAARFEAAGREAGFRVERFGQVEGCPLLALTRRTPGRLPRIYLSAGIHGDEPAPPLALLDLLESGAFDRRAVWFLCPLLNPAGFDRRARENAAGIDLNRDFRDPQSDEIRAHVAWLRRQPRFDCTLCVHEDWEAGGFYLYEQNPLGRPSLAGPMLRAAAAFCPIDPSEVIDGREAKQGIIRPLENPFDRSKWPESIYLRANHTSLAYTIETPSAFPLADRIAAHRAALGAAIESFFATSGII